MNRFAIHSPLPGRHPRIGILYPCSGTRDSDFWRLAPPGASVHIARLPFASRGTVEAVKAMASDENLEQAAALIAEVEPAVVAWADTSGSFLFGPEGDLRQIELLTQVTHAPATTTSTAMVEVCHAAEVDEVDVASPYSRELNEALVAFLEARGIKVGRVEALGLEDSYAIAAVPETIQADLVRSAVGSAPAVLVPCTDFLTLSLVPLLEESLDRMVVAANPATMWHAVQLIGTYPAGFGAGLGRILNLSKDEVKPCSGSGKARHAGALPGSGGSSSPPTFTVPTCASENS